MQARKTTTKGSPDQVDKAKEVVEAQVIPAAQEFQGFLGGYWLADRQTGEGLTITFFDTPENLDASSQSADKIRTSSTQAIGVDVTGVEHFEVVAKTGDKVHRTATAARVVTWDADPSRVGDGIKNIEENVIPSVTKFAGFQGGFWMLDRSSGKGVGVTLFDTPESLRASGDAVKQVRQRSIDATDADISQPREYEVIARSVGVEAGTTS